MKGINTIWALREKVGWFQRAERGPFQLTNGPLSARWVGPSTDGKRLFINGCQERNEFLVYDLKSGQFVPAFGGISEEALEFSKDGKWSSPCLIIARAKSFSALARSDPRLLSKNDPVVFSF